MSPYQEAALESYTFHNEMDASNEDRAPASALGLPRDICLSHLSLQIHSLLSFL